MLCRKNDDFTYISQFHDIVILFIAMSFYSENFKHLFLLLFHRTVHSDNLSL